MGSKPKAPKQTAAQRAFDIEQRKALNEETIDENKRKKALTRGTLGSASLLSGVDDEQLGASSGVQNGGSAPIATDTGTSKKIGTGPGKSGGKKRGVSRAGTGAGR